ncbi:MAG: permease-like cell division protein FtsX [Bacteroidales bacterium]|nr:permease-like cell division protein FtsX [Bacteroidales bacterium]
MVNKEKGIIVQRIIQAYLSSVISITLVLFLIGAAVFLGVHAQKFVRYFKENMTLSVILKEGIPEEEALLAVQQIQTLPYVREAVFISQEEGTREMAEFLGADFLEQFDFNPIPVSIEVRMLAQYMTPEYLDTLEEEITRLDGVREMFYQRSVIEQITKNMERMGLGLLIFTGLMLFVSFVLINNTIRLSVYARRFTIHTMRLVGATKGFIRRPFMAQAFFQGLISGLLAVLMLLGALSLARNDLADIYYIIDYEFLFILFVIVVLTGIGLCLCATYLVVNKVVRIDSGALYY